jgi:hypothetical protein
MRSTGTSTATFDETVAEIRRFIANMGSCTPVKASEICRSYVAVLGSEDAQLVETDGNPVVFDNVRSADPLKPRP